VRVIDCATNTVVDTLAVGDFPLCIAFDSTGDYATVTNYMAGSYSVMHIDGANSSVIATRSSGQHAMRLAYNRALDQMGIGNYGAKTLTLADPRTGALINTISYTSYGALAGVDFDLAGNPVVLTASTGNFLGHVHKGSDHVELPAVPAQFDYCPATDMAAVAGPGPDFVSFVNWTPQGAAEVRTPIPPALKLEILPNPCRVSTTIHLSGFSLLSSPLSLSLYDASGRLVRHSTLDIRHSTLALDLRSMTAGVYLVRLTAGGTNLTQKLVLTE
jgi:hypothetical protein